MKRFITYLLCCMALAIISLSLNSCKYHGRNENIPDKYGEEIIESLAADKEEKEEQEALEVGSSLASTTASQRVSSG